jgi:hypothetical protein
MNVWAIVVVLGVLAAACGGTSDSESQVFGFDQIAPDGAVIETDPSGTVATLRVTTAIDAVCAVAYGETETLGQLGTDQEMGAAGHSDHEVLLGGLEPDTEYFYRLQGVGVDGRLYQSELATFRTPPATDALSGRNVAVDAGVAEVSSEFSGAFAAANAIDGNRATEWSTRDDGDNAYLVIDLGREVEIIAIGFHTRSMSDGTATAETYTVTVDSIDTHGPYPVGRVDVTFTGRLIRFDVESSTGGNTGATEIEVFERP